MSLTLSWRLPFRRDDRLHKPQPGSRYRTPPIPTGAPIARTGEAPAAGLRPREFSIRPRSKFVLGLWSRWCQSASAADAALASERLAMFRALDLAL
jgi:hypothetical protein